MEPRVGRKAFSERRFTFSGAPSVGDAVTPSSVVVLSLMLTMVLELLVGAGGGGGVGDLEELLAKAAARQCRSGPLADRENNRRTSDCIKRGAQE